MKIGAIILAAGASSRLGSPKQLLLYEGETLIRRSVLTALATSCRPVVVVLGANSEQVRPALAGLDVEIVSNAFWPQGVGTSIRMGLAALDGRTEQTVDAALLMVCDQPLVGAAELLRLVIGFKSAGVTKGIAAAKYDDTVGVPVIFGRAYFPALHGLPDDAGAKQILLANAAAVTEIDLPKAAIDIDTREQYASLTIR